MGDRLPLRQAVALLPQGDALHEESHVPGQGAHGLQALGILGSLTGLTAVDAVPVLAGGHGHPADGEELVELVEGGGQSATPGRHHAGSHLHGLVEGGAVEEPGQEGHQSGVGRGVIDRAPHHQAVAGGEKRGHLVDDVIEHAAAGLRAPAAGDAAADVAGTYVDVGGLDPLGGEDLLHLPQGKGGVPLGAGAAVDHQNVHSVMPPFME